jgi:hypothetical protein
MVWGLGVMVYGLGLRVHGVRFRARELGCDDYDLGFRA